MKISIEWLFLLLGHLVILVPLGLYLFWTRPDNSHPPSLDELLDMIKAIDAHSERQQCFLVHPSGHKHPVGTLEYGDLQLLFDSTILGHSRIIGRVHRGKRKQRDVFTVYIMSTPERTSHMWYCQSNRAASKLINKYKGALPT